MMKKAIATMVILFGASPALGFVTLNDTRPLYDADPASGFGIATQEDMGSSSLTGRIVQIGNRTLTPLIPINGQVVPGQNLYQGGTITVGNLMNRGKPGVDKRNYYEIRIKGKNGNISGSFLVPETVLSGLDSYTAAERTNEALKYFRGNPMFKVPCSGQVAGQTNPTQEESYRNQLYKQRAERRPSVLPASRYTTASRSGDTLNRRDDIGNAPFAGGTAVSVGNSNGLVNTKSDDPNADNATPGCEVLTAKDNERESNPELEFNRENLNKCIGNIQNYILQDITPPAKGSDRNTVFSRLFELPNQEQEFAAAIFTLSGEMEKGNISDGLMILKVLSNRRDNSNGVEDELEQCKKNFSSDQGELLGCYANVNKDSTFNLLDAALHKVRGSKYGQFSMYNDPGGSTEGNWNKTIGNPAVANWDEQLEVFLNYSKVEEYKITGDSNANINKIYHYTRPEWDPSWARGKTQLRISAIHPEDGEQTPTQAHVYFEMLDGPSDGFAMNITHEFRRFP